MPTFTIDGRELTVPNGTTIMQAAHANGIPIPHYCYHPGLSIAGNCRICLVEVEKFPKPAIACNTIVADGMVVHTQEVSEKAVEWQRAIMEFLLINHPLDCPICDQAGECKLQDYSFKHGPPTTRFKEEKEHGPKRRDLGPHVVFDWERCIKCTRCIRFCDEVSETGELDMFLRGVHEEIGIFPGRPLDNPYSGNVVDICPVGALTLREARFAPLVYFLTDVPSTCPGCARGCSINLATYRNEVVRITPRENQQVNRWWICDHGRMWGKRLSRADEQRLSGCRYPGQPSGAQDETDDPWQVATDAAVTALRESTDGGRSGAKIRLLASPRASVEALYLFAKLAKALGGATVHLATHEQGEDDSLLIRADKTPNKRGAELILDELCSGARPISELEQALRQGEADLLLALGPGLVGPVHDELPPLDPSLMGKAGQLIVLDACRSPMSDAASFLFPVLAFGEEEGCYVNFGERIQHSARGLVPKTDCRPITLILGDLLSNLTNEPLLNRDSVREKLSKEVPAFAQVDWSALPGAIGQQLPQQNGEPQAACRVTGAVATMLQNGWEAVPPTPRGKPPWVW